MDIYFISYFSGPLEEQDQSEKLENGDPAIESDEKPLGEEIKLQKELDENEKDKGQEQEQNQNNNNENQNKIVEETAIETEIEKDKVIEEKKVHEEENKKTASAPAPALANRFEALQSKNKTQIPTKIIGGSEEDEEDGYLIEEEDADFEWDYEEEDTKKTKTEAEAEDQGNISDYIEVDEPKEESIPKVSLNPLPPERLMPRTSEEREKSSEPGQDEVIY